MTQEHDYIGDIGGIGAQNISTKKKLILIFRRYIQLKMKYININRTNNECLTKVIQYIEKNNTYKYEIDRKKAIEYTKILPLKDLRYIDNNIRIFEARKNWVQLIQDVIDLLL